MPAVSMMSQMEPSFSLFQNSGDEFSLRYAEDFFSIPVAIDSHFLIFQLKIGLYPPLRIHFKALGTDTFRDKNCLLRVVTQYQFYKTRRELK